MKNLKKDIVVALYHENLNWIYDNELQDRTYLYLKKKERINEYDGLKYKEVINNVGRESHTYLYHIIKNYDNLSDILVFSQGHPFDHINKEYFIETLKNYENINGFKAIGDWKITLKNFICNYHSGIPIRKCCEELFINPPEVFEFTTGGIFVVDKNTILKRPKKFYEKCLKYLDYHVNPLEGFVFERIWNIIFNPYIEIKID